MERAAWGMPPGGVLFASAANFFKLIPEFIDTCLKILSDVKDSHLLLMPFGPNWSNQYPRSQFLEHLWEMARRRGVAPARLHVLNREPAPNRQDVKELLKSADVYLDSYPFAGSTSLMEPLEVGLPVVVCRGTQLRGAMAAGIMQELNLPELIAGDEASYIRIAAELGRDAELRKRRREATIAAMAAGPRFTDPRLYAARIAPLLKSMLPSQ
jgi:predicted O-linked N-acetylglucosamine transferase (SPINDLY family)